MTSTTLKETPLFNKHNEMGAKLVDFGGWNMPIHYGSQIDEHHQVRKDAGMFDVCHMTIVDLRGTDVYDYLARLMANDIAKIADKPGKALYSCMLNNDGGVIDDLIIYAMEPDWARVIVNSATREKDLNWMRSQIGDSAVELTERDDLAMIAIQGPNARELAGKALGDQIAGAEDLKPFNAILKQSGSEAERFVARTGYTGEDGFELYLPAATAVEVWQQLMAAGAPHGLLPVGLGARDTLRLEKGYALYGHELSREVSPLEAGLAWITKLDKDDFVGKAALVAQKQDGLPRRRAGLVMQERGIPREGYPVFAGDREVGVVTSGTMSPSLKVGIALALVAPDAAAAGTELEIAVRNNRMKAKVARPPFVE